MGTEVALNPCSYMFTVNRKTWDKRKDLNLEYEWCCNNITNLIIYRLFCIVDSDSCFFRCSINKYDTASFRQLCQSFAMLRMLVGVCIWLFCLFSAVFLRSTSKSQLQRQSHLLLFVSSPSTYPVTAKTNHRPALTASISMFRGMALISSYLHTSHVMHPYPPSGQTHRWLYKGRAWDSCNLLCISCVVKITIGCYIFLFFSFFFIVLKTKFGSTVNPWFIYSINEAQVHVLNVCPRWSLFCKCAGRSKANPGGFPQALSCREPGYLSFSHVTGLRAISSLWHNI